MLSIWGTSRLAPKLIKTLTILILSAPIALTGCTSARKKQTPEERPWVGPTAAPSNGEPRESYGPDAPPPREKSGKIVVVFGPGFAKGFAAAGVLRRLQELQIPVGRIYAHEVSALVSAIHLTSANPNRVDWALMKLKDAPLVRPKGLSLTSPEGKVESRLSEIFGAKTLETLNPSLRVAEYEQSSGALRMADSGEIKTVVRTALGGEASGLRPESVQGEVRQGRPSQGGFEALLREVKSQEIDPVLIVSYGPLTPAEKGIYGEGEAEILEVPLKLFDDADLTKRNQIVYQGKEIVSRHQARIENLAGIEPRNESSP